jgi:cell division transport system ATP-binding protein
MKVVFSHVNKTFGVINAISDIDFSVDPGEFLFMVGPSGAGKSTILKLILNQIQPTSGEIIIDEYHLAKLEKHKIDKIRRQIGVIFQDYQLIPDKTIEENIALALDINNFSPSLISEKIETVIKQVNLNNRRHLFPSQLSGGELQRASLARALAVDPKIILADEPTGNLDIENSWNLIKLLKDINEKLGTTIIMTTHNLDILKSLDKRIITINNGSIISDTILEPKKKSEIKKNHTHLPTK